MWDLSAPDQGSNLTLVLECKALTTGPPGKSSLHCLLASVVSDEESAVILTFVYPISFFLLCLRYVFIFIIFLKTFFPFGYNFLGVVFLYLSFLDLWVDVFNHLWKLFDHCLLNISFTS